MEYIMTALGIVIILGLACIGIMLCPIIFNLFVIGASEFMSLCRWLRHKVIMSKYDEKNDMIISKARYAMLLEAFNTLYADDINATDNDETLYATPRNWDKFINPDAGTIAIEDINND